MAFYEEFSRYYDEIFPLSPGKLKFIREQLREAGAREILDVGTGTGSYARALARMGYSVIGLDLDQSMIEQARSRVEGESLQLDFYAEDMLRIGDITGPNSMDGILVIGNVLVHLPDRDMVYNFLKQTASLLRPGGVIIVQIINYDRILDKSVTNLPRIVNEEEGISFTRNYSLDADTGLVDFKTRLSVKRDQDGLIKSYLNSISLLPLRSAELVGLLSEAGFQQIKLYGSFRGECFEPDSSLPCIVVARGRDSKNL